MKKLVVAGCLALFITACAGTSENLPTAPGNTQDTLPNNPQDTAFMPDTPYYRR